jgi:hypothetical protein
MPTSARAAAPLQARVSVDRSRLRMGEELVLVLEFERSGPGTVPAPELPPDIEEAFDLLQCVPRAARDVAVVNGRTTRTESRALRCVLSPRKPGTFEVTLSTTEGGEIVRSNTVSLEVAENDEPQVADGSQMEPTEPRGDIFLWASVDRTRAYVGEQITYALDVYESRRFLDPQLRTPPAFGDFLSEEIPVGQPRLTSVGGMRYRVRPALRRALFPQRAGTLTIGAAEITLGLRRREQAAAIEIEVMPLPAKGRPARFSPNNVGSYDIETSVDRTRVRAGEPFTLTVSISGRGNIDVIDPPPWPEMEWARRYEPKVETQRSGSDVIGGQRTYDFLVIPTGPGSFEVPPHELSFFDPGPETYVTVRSEPIRIEVTGEASTAAATPTEPTDERLEFAPIFAVETLARPEPSEPWLNLERWTYGMLAVPAGALLGLGAGFVWRRFGPDAASAARNATRARRRALIEAAERGVESGEGFHAAIARLLHDLAIERTGPEGVGLPRSQLVERLAERGVIREDLDRFVTMLEDCDAARFAAQLGTVERRKAALDDALKLLRRSTLSGKGAP